MSSLSASFCRPSERDSPPFRAARAAFSALTRGPHPVCVNGGLFAGLPNADLPLDQLRDVLLNPDCGQATRDAVWADLVRRARGSETWMVGCLGLALPALVRVATHLSARFAGDPSEVHAAVLSGFVTELDRVDCQRRGIVTRLRWGAYRAGYLAVHEALSAPPPTPATAEQEPGEDAADRAVLAVQAPSGHPDFVLAHAVADGALTITESELIAATRLGDLTVASAAAARGATYAAVHQARRRAEARLSRWLRDRPEPDRVLGPGQDEGATRASESVTLARATPTGPIPSEHSLSVSGRQRQGRTTSARRVSKTNPSSRVPPCEATRPRPTAGTPSSWERSS